MRIIREIRDFFAGFRETVVADPETTPATARWAVFVILVIVLSAVIWVLIARFL